MFLQIRARKDHPEDFWSNVDRSAGADACWPWKKFKLQGGYGRLTASKKSWLAHRRAWFLINGDTDLCVLHKCDNPPCCNPRHLFVGTLKENTRDMVKKNRHSKGEKHTVSKLTASEVIYIRNAKNIKSTSLATMFNVSRGTIWLIRVGRIWKSIPL